MGEIRRDSSNFAHLSEGRVYSVQFLFAVSRGSSGLLFRYLLSDILDGEIYISYISRFDFQLHIKLHLVRSETIRSKNIKLFSSDFMHD